jgi:hypothetical protein
MNENCLIAKLYAEIDDSPEEAASKIAEEWLHNPTNIIDVWGDQDYWFGKSFINKFFDLCKEKNKLEESFEIFWVVHEPPTVDDQFLFANVVTEWINEWRANQYSTNRGKNGI